MGLITVSGQPGGRHDEAARLAAQRLRFEYVGETRLQAMLEEEFGADPPPPDRAWPLVASSILARLATEHHLVISAPGAEFLFPNLAGVLRAQVVAPVSRRVGMLMLERRLDRAGAKRTLEEIERAWKLAHKRRFGRATSPAHLFDLVLNSETLETDQIASLIEAAARAKTAGEFALLPAAAEAQMQFQLRLQLARHGITPPGKVSLKRNHFVHPSEEIFANLLDFYRIAWEYEPRSFPIQWDQDGRVLESFTPDFFLPEFNLYVELTTMKQSLVTRKNRKVKLLRTIYPHINIQVFYQKDFQNLIFKYGLAERALPTA